ncbi:hypothetical protein ACRRTK_009404 [Alexandromys fortis]
MPEPQRLWGGVKPEFRFQSARVQFPTVTFACPVSQFSYLYGGRYCKYRLLT